MKVISKVIPEKIKTLNVRWCKTEFMEMSDEYRKIRNTLRNPMNSCYWCGHKFDNGEMMALVCLVDIGNKVFCQECCLSIEDKEATDE